VSHPSQYPQPYQPYQQPPRKGTSWGLISLAVVGGGVVLLAVVCCGSVAYLLQPPAASAAARQPFVISDVPIPAFPDRGELATIAPQVTATTISLGDSGGYYGAPGLGGKLILYLPPGNHEPKSLPCILITGAGSDLLSGMSLSDGDQPEHLPYVQAGFAVLAYELDGPNSTEGDSAAMKRAFAAFQAARAGLVNARNALEFVLEKVPEVNPQKIYAAGHSSAATHALLFAEHEPRLAGVVAYAPAVNLPKRFGFFLRALATEMPEVVDFAAQSSPHTHRERLKCPTFLFHAEDDSTCPIAETRALADQLKQQGTDVTLETVKSGDHYESMIGEGIPAAIRWLSTKK
jgi:dipeptidyl aminopeptidase/acylaminoacyl peptidase